MENLPTPEELDELLDVAQRVALACGRLITDERPRGLGVDHTKSSATDIVTIMDSRSEELARSELARLRPEDGILGEEGSDVVGTSGITWLVDPIDGTVNYLYEIDAHAVSVAATVGDPHVEGAWFPVAGAVFRPIADELFLARRGGGAVLRRGNEQSPLAISTRTDLAQCLVGTGFGYSSAARAKQGRVVAEVLPKVRDIRRIGSAALDLCSVAAGRLDCYYEGGVNAWDIAAAWVVVEEAGGVVRGARGRRPTRALTLAGSATTVEALEQLVTDALAKIDPTAEQPDLT